MQSHKRRRCEEDDGDFDFNRPPSRQRSESLFRRQQELFNAMNMDFNDNDKQQEEDQNFDLELPFDVQGSDVNNDGANAPFDNIVSYLSFDSINNNNNDNNVSTGQDFVDICHIFSSDEDDEGGNDYRKKCSDEDNDDDSCSTTSSSGNSVSTSSSSSSSSITLAKTNTMKMKKAKYLTTNVLPPNSNNIDNDNNLLSTNKNGSSTKKYERRLEKKVGSNLLPLEYQKFYKRGFRITMQVDSPLSDQYVWNRMLDDLRVIGFLEGRGTGTLLQDSIPSSTNTIGKAKQIDDKNKYNNKDSSNNSNSLKTSEKNESNARSCYPLVFTKYCYDFKLYRLILKHLPILFATRLSILRLLAFYVLQSKEGRNVTSVDYELNDNDMTEIIEQTIRFFEETIVNTDVEQRLGMTTGDDNSHDDISNLHNNSKQKDAKGRTRTSPQKTKRIRLDLTLLGTKLLKVKTWQPTLSTKFVLPVISTCKSLCERAAAKFSRFSKTKDELSSTINLPQSNDTHCLFSISPRTLKGFAAFNHKENISQPLSQFPWDSNVDKMPSKHTITKVRQIVLHMLCANIELCGFFCIEQLWGTGSICDYICNKIEVFVSEIPSSATSNKRVKVLLRRDSVAPEIPCRIEKTRVTTYPLKSIYAIPINSIKSESDDKDVMIDKEQKPNMVVIETVYNPVTSIEKELFISKETINEEFVRHEFVKGMKLYAYFLSFSMVILLFGIICLPNFQNAFFVCEFIVVKLYLFNKLWLERKIESCKSKSNILYLRKVQNVWVYAATIVACVLIMFLDDNPHIPLNSEQKKVTGDKVLAGASVMAIYTTYNATYTMTEGLTTAIMLGFFILRHYVIDGLHDGSKVVGEPFGIPVSYSGTVFLSGIIGAAVGDIAAMIILSIKRKAYIQIASNKLNVKPLDIDPDMHLKKKQTKVDILTNLINISILIFTLIRIVKYYLFPMYTIDDHGLLLATPNHMVVVGFTAIVGMIAIYVSKK